MFGHNPPPVSKRKKCCRWYMDGDLLAVTYCEDLYVVHIHVMAAAGTTESCVA